MWKAATIALLLATSSANAQETRKYFGAESEQGWTKGEWAVVTGPIAFTTPPDLTGNKAVKLLKVNPIQGPILVPEITQKTLGDLLNPVPLAKQKPLDSKSDFGG